MGEKENMQHETYKKDKEIKKTVLEIQESVDEIKDKVEKVNKELESDEIGRASCRERV